MTKLGIYCGVIPFPEPVRSQRMKRVLALKDFLTDMSKRGEKHPPKYFVGRNAEIKSILDFRDNWDDEDPIKAPSHIISGAPGAGKTSLMREVAKRWPDDQEGASAIMLGNPPESDAELREAYADIAVALGALDRKELQTTTTAEGGGSAGFKGIVQGKLGIGQSVAPVDKPGSLAEIAGLPSYSPEKARQRRVVVLVDEVQNVRPESPGAKLIKDLHNEQKDLPILLVCFGLADSEIRIAKAGTTQFEPNKLFPIGVLSEPEANACVKQYLQAAVAAGLPAEADTIDRWAKRITAESDRWPRHVHCYLKASWGALLDMSAPNLNECDLDAAMMRGNEYRRQYYRDRVTISGVDIDIIRPLVAAIQQAGTDGLSKRDATEIIHKAAMSLPLTVKEEYDELFGRASNCLMSLLHAGVVTHSNHQDELFFSVPIPTMMDHVMGRNPSTPKHPPEPQTEPPGFNP